MTTSLGVRNLLSLTLASTLLCPAGMSGSEASLAWIPSPDPRTAGYHLHYGLTSGIYTASVDTQTNLAATIDGLMPGLTYYFAVAAYDAEGNESTDSNEVTNRVPILPQIVAQPLNQTAIVGAAATLTVSAWGDAPLSFQWLKRFVPIPGATNSLLRWPQISVGDAGKYTVVVSNPWGATTSSVVMLTVLVPPSITAQPQSQTVVATTAACFSCAVTGMAPMSLQWYDGNTAIAGATNSVLGWASVAASNAGTYHLTAANAAGAVMSSAATLTVLPTNTIATAAGVYNGLFFQTNADGTPDVTEATAGFLGNCVVAASGAFSATAYINGVSSPFTGAFDGSGNATATIPLAASGLSDLTAVLCLDLINGTQQLTGSISSTASGNAWSAPLLAELATNACPQLAGISILLSPGLSANSPTNNGSAIGLVSGGVLTLSGSLGDTTAFSQNVPISRNGNVPIYASLYTNGGLVAGWINVGGGAVTGNLAWIRPGGVLQPSGFPLGFDTAVQATGATYAQGVGYMAASGPGTYASSWLTSSTSGWMVFQDTDGSQYYELTGSGFIVTANGSLTFWACAGNNDPTPNGAITTLYLLGDNPALTSMDVRGLAGLQFLSAGCQISLACVNASGCAALTNLLCNSCWALTSVNVSGCVSLTSISCDFDSADGTIVAASNCASLASLSDITSCATVACQNAIIASLPAFNSGTHTLYWSCWAPANPAGDAAAAAKGWTVDRSGG